MHNPAYLSMVLFFICMSNRKATSCVLSPLWVLHISHVSKRNRRRIFGVCPMFPPQPAHLLHQEQGRAVMVGFRFGFPHVRLCRPPDNHPAPALPVLLCHRHASPICHHWGHLQKGKRPQQRILGLSRLGVSCRLMFYSQTSCVWSILQTFILLDVYSVVNWKTKRLL